MMNKKLSNKFIFVVKETTSGKGFIYCFNNNYVQSFCEAQKYKPSSKDNAFIITPSQLKGIKKEASRCGFQGVQILPNPKSKNHNIFSQLSDAIKYKFNSRKYYILYTRALALFREGLQRKKDEKIVQDFWSFLGIPSRTASADCKVGEIFKDVEAAQLYRFGSSSLRILASLGRVGKYIVLEGVDEKTIDELTDLRSKFQEWGEERVNKLSDKEIKIFIADTRNPCRKNKKRSSKKLASYEEEPHSKNNSNQGKNKKIIKKDKSTSLKEGWLVMFDLLAKEIKTVKQIKKNKVFSQYKNKNKETIVSNQGVLTQLMDMAGELLGEYKGNK